MQPVRPVFFRQCNTCISLVSTHLEIFLAWIEAPGYRRPASKSLEGDACNSWKSREATPVQSLVKCRGGEARVTMHS